MSAASGPEPASFVEGLRRHLLRRERMGLRRVQTAAPPDAAVAAAVPSPAEPERPVAGGPEPAQAKRQEPRPGPGPQAGAPTPAPPAEGALAPPLPVDLAPKCLDWRQLQEAVASCQACELCQTRQQTVFADGTSQAGGVFFIGEAPGAEEDRTGVPFVGRAGQLLTDIIEKGMGLRRDQVTIANVLKCRPPGNRDPKPSEKALCTPFLDRQIELVAPKVLIPLGTHAAQHVLGVNTPISRLRGRVHELNGRAVVPTFHPAFLLRNPGAKRDCWQDIQLAMQVAGLPVPPRG